jgi:hypothetical protein
MPVGFQNFVIQLGCVESFVVRTTVDPSASRWPWRFDPCISLLVEAGVGTNRPSCTWAVAG